MTIGLLLTILPFHLAFAGAMQTLAPVTEADGRLGLCNVLPDDPTGVGVRWSQLAYNAGARINRWEFRWDHIESTQNVWDYTATDAVVQSSRQGGLDVLGILIGTPGWATAAGQKPGNGVPKGLGLPFSSPQNVWAEYVRQTVERYDTQVKYWEVWNEPDLRFFWSGTSENYFQLLKVAYLAIKSVDPKATVLMAGMVVPDLSFFAHVLGVAQHDQEAAAHSHFFDAVAWHAYGQARMTYTSISAMRAQLSSRGLSAAPVWISEDGFPASNPNGEARQAAYVLQTVAYALAAGASKVLVYRASDDVLPKTWGLLTASGQPRMGYVAYQVAARYFANARSIVYDPASGVERLSAYKPQQRIRVLWNTGLDDRSVSVSAAQPGATLVDWMGGTSRLQAVDGAFHIMLPGAQYNRGVDPSSSVVGGPPRLLIEDNVPPQGLSSFHGVTPVPGKNRRLLILNPSPAPAAVMVAPGPRPWQRAVLQLPPWTVRPLDLDLLAGSQFMGMYWVSGSTPTPIAAVSDSVVIRDVQPAVSWYAPNPSGEVAVVNSSPKQSQVTLSLFGTRGRLRWRTTAQVSPWHRATWTLPSLTGIQLGGLSVRSSTPVVASMDGMAHLTQSHATWYAVRTAKARLGIFNPDVSHVAYVDVQLHGSATVSGEQIRVAPHHLFLLRTHGASSATITASSDIVVGAARGRPRALLTADVTTGSALPLPNAQRVLVYNPSTQRTRVTLTLIHGSSRHEVTRNLAPFHLLTQYLRGTALQPAAVVLKSNSPVSLYTTG